MSNLVWDIEGDGLHPSVIWCAVTMDTVTKEIRQYSNHDPKLPPISEFIMALEAADTWIGHNIIRWDIPQLKRLWGLDDSKVKIIDTLVLSRLNNWPRPQTRGKHGLDPWGELVGVKKPPIKGWMEWDPEFIVRCTEDVKINEKVYRIVVQEAQALIKENELYREAMRVEHEMEKLMEKQTTDGWLFDFDACQSLIDAITIEMKEIEETIEPHLSPITKVLDKEPRIPQYKKNGEYTMASARMISQFLGRQVNPEDALRTEPPMQPGERYQRTEVLVAGMGQQDSVRAYVESLGVVWTQWNWKKINGEFVRMSPKMNDGDLLRVDHPHTKGVSEYYTLRSRRSILQGWMEQKDGDGRLRGDVMNMGARSFRQVHKVIANIPSPKAKYGADIRRLFICPEDKTIISVDSASCQLRILAHFLGDQGYTDTILHGDAHQRHADAMETTRDKAKPAAFAILYGCGAGKLASILSLSEAEAGKIKRNFVSNVPNLSKLIDQSKATVESRGFLRGIDGRRIYPDEAYKSMNYIIQGTEAILMKASLVMVAEGFKEAGIEFKHLFFAHDEVSYEIDPKDVPKASEIISNAFIEAPKKYGINIMGHGDILTGGNYLEVH